MDQQDPDITFDEAMFEAYLYHWLDDGYRHPDPDIQEIGGV
jgi:hypothetical protein